jgi:hypothetical protein
LLVWDCLGLFLTSTYNYLLFHSLSEIASILVMYSVFIVAWNTRRFLDNNYLLFIGIAYLFVGSIDLIHTLGYQGMGVFPGLRCKSTHPALDHRPLPAGHFLVHCPLDDWKDFAHGQMARHL